MNEWILEIHSLLNAVYHSFQPEQPLPPPPPQPLTLTEELTERLVQLSNLKIISFFLQIGSEKGDPYYFRVIICCICILTVIRFFEWLKGFLLFLFRWMVPVLALYGFSQLPYIEPLIMLILKMINNTPALYQEHYTYQTKY
jgi:hypothetical protein